NDSFPYGQRQVEHSEEAEDEEEGEEVDVKVMQRRRIVLDDDDEEEEGEEEALQGQVTGAGKSSKYYDDDSDVYNLDQIDTERGFESDRDELAGDSFLAGLQTDYSEMEVGTQPVYTEMDSQIDRDFDGRILEEEDDIVSPSPSETSELYNREESDVDDEDEDETYRPKIKEATPVEDEDDEEDEGPDCDEDRDLDVDILPSSPPRSPSPEGHRTPQTPQRSSNQYFKKKPLVSEPVSPSPTKHPALYKVGKTMSPYKPGTGFRYQSRDNRTHTSVTGTGLFGASRSTARPLARPQSPAQQHRSSSVASNRSDASDMSAGSAADTCTAGVKYKRESDFKGTALGHSLLPWTL
ncbi:hypothetical protein BJ508DRAFT_337116, partial [Ascobolus immersus RN42]